jgi:hypothetical protein
MKLMLLLPIACLLALLQIALAKSLSIGNDLVWKAFKYEFKKNYSSVAEELERFLKTYIQTASSCLNT